jgi:hypothetical protein
VCALHVSVGCIGTRAWLRHSLKRMNDALNRKYICRLVRNVRLRCVEKSCRQVRKHS